MRNNQSTEQSTVQPTEQSTVQSKVQFTEQPTVHSKFQYTDQSNLVYGVVILVFLVIGVCVFFTSNNKAGEFIHEKPIKPKRLHML